MIRFFNGKTLFFSPGAMVNEDEVWTDGEQIVYRGPSKKEMPVFEREIDLHGNLIMPGFKNAHTHTPMVFLRSMADDKPLMDWLQEDCWPNEAKLNDEAVYMITKLGIMEYLSSGITCTFDMYNHSKSYAEANLDSGFRTVILSGMNDFDPDPTEIERNFLQCNNMGSLVSYRLGIHAEYTTGEERLNYMISLAEKYKAPCFTHLSETKDEVNRCISRHGKTPARFLFDSGFFKYGGGGIHCCYLTDEEISLFAENGLAAVTCPASNLKLASGIAPVEKMRAAGIKVAIGTDGAASNNALDMFREMYLTAVLQKHLEHDASACPADEVLKMACVNGAEILGLFDCNNLAEGKKADLAVIDLSRPNMRPLNNIPKNIVYAGSKDNVVLTMVNGAVLYENGRFNIGEDPDIIYAYVNKFVKGLNK